MWYILAVRNAKRQFWRNVGLPYRFQRLVSDLNAPNSHFFDYIFKNYQRVKNMMRFLHGQMIVATLTALWSIGSILAHAQSTCVVDVSKPGAIVAPICRGQQLEEFNHQFEGGLYAQLINNPSFEELKNPIAGWYLVKTGSSNANLYPQTSSDTGMLNSRQNHCY